MNQEHQIININNSLFVSALDRQTDVQTDTQTDRQTCRHADRQDAALVTSHLHHPLVQRAAGRRLCAPSSCRRLHWFTRRTHVGAYPTHQPPCTSSSSTGQTEEPASGGTARQRRTEPSRPAAAAAPTGRTGPR